MANGGFTPLALHRLLEALYGVRTSYTENPENVSIGVVPLRILPVDPMRVGFIVTNLSGNSVYLAPRATVASSRGIFLAANGGSLSLVWDRDFELCSSDWWAVASGAASTIYVLANVVR